MNRRQMLAGLASSALVVGFDPVTRLWIRATEASGSFPCLPFANTPPLDGVLYTDLSTRESDSTDKGNMVKVLPCAVLRPAQLPTLRR